MVNRHRPHVLVLPEDDANRQLATGFLLDDSLRTRNIKVLEEVGGWAALLDRFTSDHVVGMEKYPDRIMILLVDFDGNVNRLEAIKARIPQSLAARVFILGALREPEELRTAGLGTYEAIGKAMAADCREGTSTIWGHPLLRHNQEELERLRLPVCPVLFPRLQ